MGSKARPWYPSCGKYCSRHKYRAQGFWCGCWRMGLVAVTPAASAGPSPAPVHGGAAPLSQSSGVGADGPESLWVLFCRACLASFLGPGVSPWFLLVGPCPGLAVSGGERLFPARAPQLPSASSREMNKWSISLVLKIPTAFFTPIARNTVWVSSADFRGLYNMYNITFICFDNY